MEAVSPRIKVSMAKVEERGKWSCPTLVSASSITSLKQGMGVNGYTAMVYWESEFKSNLLFLLFRPNSAAQ